MAIVWLVFCAPIVYMCADGPVRAVAWHPVFVVLIQVLCVYHLNHILLAVFHLFILWSSLSPYPPPSFFPLVAQQKHFGDISGLVHHVEIPFHTQLSEFNYLQIF